MYQVANRCIAEFCLKKLKYKNKMYKCNMNEHPRCKTSVRNTRWKRSVRIPDPTESEDPWAGDDESLPPSFSKDKYELNISIQIRSRVNRRYLCAGERGPSSKIAERGSREATRASDLRRQRVCVLAIAEVAN